MFKRFVTLSVVVLAAILAFGVVGSAAAQGPGGQGEQDGRPPRGGAFNEERQAALAEALGITVEELQAYRDQDLTIPEIAEELGVDLESLDLPFINRRAERLQAMADVLGISVEELEAYREQGLSLPEIAEELGVELPERPNSSERNEAIAEAFGITVEQLADYRAQGLTLEEIAEELGLDIESLDLPQRNQDGRPNGPRGVNGQPEGAASAEAQQ